MGLRLELSRNKSVEEAFRRTGVRITPQRFSVFEHLMLHPDHATVDDLAVALNRRYAKASRATVYNTLHALVEAGLVREFTLDGKAARYDANIDPHHHFVCDVCGAVEDLEWFEVPALQKQPESKMPRTQKGERSVSAYNVSAHNVRSYEVIVRGECRRCR